MTGGRRRGRRPGGPDTRSQILEAARESFSARGFQGTTIRSVAAAAGVDAALVHHYFGTKDDLFLASIQAPVDPRAVLAEVLGAGLPGAGQRLVAGVLGAWDEPEARRPLVALVRSSLGDPESSLLREGFLRLVLRGMAETLVRGGVEPAEAEVRSQLVASQMVGLLMTRYVLALQPMASLPSDRVAKLVGPTVQRYLDGALEAGGVDGGQCEAEYSTRDE